jgi:hypothetical protein
VGHLHPAGHRHRRDGDSSDSGTTIIGDIWTLAGEGEASGEEGVSKLGKILPNLRRGSFIVGTGVMRGQQEEGSLFRKPLFIERRTEL